MHPFFSAVLAEWQIARARLLRTRLGLGLLLIGAGLVALAAHPAGPSARTVATHAAMLGAVLAVAFTLGSDLDRAALELTLAHPTSPTAVLWGRWLAATALAGALAAAAGGAAAWVGPRPERPVALALAVLVAAGATAGCATAAAVLGGNVLTAALFLYIGLAGAVPPSVWERLAPVGPVCRAVTALATVLPTGWRYGRLESGDPGDWGHALAWIAGGVSLAVLGLQARRWARRR
jgi:hypothetical protein